MKFLNKNCYSIIFGEKCNLSCSYCSYGLNKINGLVQNSVVEQSSNQIINIFERLGDITIVVSGGEPGLYTQMPTLIGGLPNAKWVFYTNLTVLPKWFFHDNTVLLICAYHETVDKEKFINNIKLLVNKDKKIFCKIIVHPLAEYRDLDIFERLCAMDVPVAFVPLEYTYFFSRDFLKDLIVKYRTSLLYNSRFFRIGSKHVLKCGAGSIFGFQINSNGDIVRCSTNQKKTGDIFNVNFLEGEEMCDVDLSCYCEWQHWNEWTLANDNEIWTDYVTKGIYKKPTIRDLYDFIKKMGWSVSGRNLEGETKSLFEEFL